MAKINVSFYDKNYPIDEASLSAAQAALRTHLSSVMNGSGATINFVGVPYNIDSAKLSATTNAFVSHLGTVAGNGYKIMVGGVEYNVDASKMSGAVADLHEVLGGLQSGGEGGSYGEVILEEQELAFEIVDGDVGAMIFKPNPIVLGEAYTVIWDGTEYNCTAVEVNGLPIIGNASINGGEDDGIPFGIAYVPTEVTGDDPMLTLLSLYDTAEATHTVGIYKVGGNSSSTATLIFDGVLTQAIKPDGSYDEFATYEDSSDVSLIVGNTYRYTYFGSSYESVCFDYQGVACIGNTLPVNGINNGHPCLIARDVAGVQGAPMWMCVTMLSIPDDFDGQVPIQIYDLNLDYLTLFAKRKVEYFYSSSQYGGLYTSGFAFPESGATNNLTDSFTLEVGETYIVEWDGVKYEVVGQDASILAAGAVGLGNGAAFGLNGNNEPFVLGVVAGQGVTFISLTETVDSHTIGIYKA